MVKVGRNAGHLAEVSCGCRLDSVWWHRNSGNGHIRPDRVRHVRYRHGAPGLDQSAEAD